jgi:hypothetical protein
MAAVAAGWSLNPAVATTVLMGEVEVHVGGVAEKPLAALSVTRSL